MLSGEQHAGEPEEGETARQTGSPPTPCRADGGLEVGDERAEPSPGAAKLRDFAKPERSLDAHEGGVSASETETAVAANYRMARTLQTVEHV